MPGTPASRTPAASKVPKLQKARPPNIRTTPPPGGQDESQQGVTLPVLISPRQKKGDGKSKVVPEISSQSSQAETGSSSAPSERKSNLGEKHDLPAISNPKSKLGPNGAHKKGNEGASAKAAAVYSSRPFGGTPIRKKKAPELQVQLSPPISPTSNGAASPGAFSSKAVADPVINAQVVAALHVLDHIEAHAQELSELGSPSAQASKAFEALSVGKETEGKAMKTTKRKVEAAAAYGNRVKKKAEEKKQLGARREQSVQVAKGIMRKMYRKNVALEKENRLLKVELDRRRKKQADDKEHGRLESESTHQETIAQLKDMVGDLQARLRQQEEGLNRGRKATGDAGRGKEDESYKKLRGDYQRLLTTRVDAVKKRGGASEEVTRMLSDMRERLLQETAERESETALFNARLQETEQQNANWYTEKKLLERHILKLEGELLERDQIDQQIEACIGSLFERMQILERTNTELNDMAMHYSQVAESTASQA